MLHLLILFFGYILGLVYGFFSSSELLYSATLIRPTSINSFQNITNSEVNENPVTEKLLIMGDVMLARDVEFKMKQFGNDYPFNNIKNLFNEYEFVVANFESSIPKNHVPTQSMQFQFSVPVSSVPILEEVGFTHFSLANNHSSDFGYSNYLNTVTALENQNLATFGKSYELSTTTSIEFINLRSKRVALIGIDLTLSFPDNKKLFEIINYAENHSDWQIVYVHWGDEYVTRHSKSQAYYAKLFIDYGADMVVGHHPHVIQDIDLYKDKLIFYSLGNFIFDQYFSFNVQNGLVIGLDFNDSILLKLIPVSTLNSRVSPNVLEGHDRSKILTNMANNSHKSLFVSIQNSEIELDENLAVSTQID
jgi:poly-gamma-glutamate synthesis protein (capsule biosynthesis protein)